MSYDMQRKARPSAPHGGSRGGLFRMLTVLSVWGMVPPVLCHAAPSTTAIPAPGAKDSRTDLVARLAHAQSAQEAALIRQALEELRLKPVRPATQLLVRRATRELGEDKPADAIEDMGAALALQSDVAALWRMRAQTRLSGGDAQGAISDLGEALQRDPEDAQSWQTLTSAEEAAGANDAALKAWEHVMALDPLMPGATKTYDKLKLKAYGQPT
ncbi:hypothetical protein KUA11_13380 [Acetobacter estunensis]|nr:hypothetical protein [Acetobacter estunensis]